MLPGFARKGAAAGIGNRARDHNRQLISLLFKNQLYGKQCRLGIQGIENGLNHNHIEATFN